MTTTTPGNSVLDPLRRPSGAFAMLAVDQREALRNMLAEHTDAPVTDDDVRDFKLTAARVLTPLASAVLIDRQFALDAAIEQGVVAGTCGLIGSADHFEPAHGELVGEVTIDRLIDAHDLKRRGAVALKLLVLHRPDESPDGRIAMTREFIDLCADAGLASIIEPVSRKPLGGGDDWDWNEGVHRAAAELGGLGADLYKAEVPRRAAVGDDELRAECARLTDAIDGPWVVLSSGVDPEVFPNAVRIACEAGASGFLAGRAVWAPSLAAADVEADLRTNATQRLQRLVDVVDDVVGTRAR
ncbi:aldolase [Microbacterium sp. No. 7]|uniref:aldolase n=1 Tax=Microbacterium sp. No. 7 TaxID=1714373 RepID=UPI0006D04F64|nr:aldolase [Microbacterium sp. No. 7]ALJ21986.1 aldolase [Microbacterium sp. No. 7]